jgi:cobalt-zinc-cadmium efflux system membrane fusion protein
VRSKAIAAAMVVAMAGGGAYLVYSGKAPKQLVERVSKLWESATHHEATAEAPPRPKRDAETPWDGLVGLDDDQIKAIGVTVMPVRAQTEPIKLELTGRTAYNENSLTKIRPRFDTLVEGVLAEKGRLVKKGDPLVELYSTELAKAKNSF